MSCRLVSFQIDARMMYSAQVQSQSGTGKTCVFCLGALQSVGERNVVENGAVNH
jgi:superfamily II DNA/RNA helicase